MVSPLQLRMRAGIRVMTSHGDNGTSVSSISIRSTERGYFLLLEDPLLITRDRAPQRHGERKDRNDSVSLWQIFALLLSALFDLQFRGVVSFVVNALFFRTLPNAR